MFATSSQFKHWMFSNEAELQSLRQEANERYVEEYGAKMLPEQRKAYFLTPSEERHLCRHFEYVLKEFCSRFQPPMPKYVLGTALCYFKRFYINCSAMDYHPKDVMLTCVYLASKVEEFNVSINLFVGNLKGDREKFANIILTFELLLMDKLNYHLLVHNPYRPLEGLFIDLKTRFRVLENPEKLRKGAEDFLEKSLMTDVCLLFAPSQIALTAVLVSAAKEKANLDRYVTETLLKGMSSEEIKKLQVQIKKLRHVVKSQEQIPREQMAQLQRKLDQCRNQENNPESEVYKRKLQEMLDEDEEIQTKKRKKISEGLNGNQLYSKVDSIDPLIGHDFIQSGKTTATDNPSSPNHVANLNIHQVERPILNGVVNRLSPDENKEMRITDVKLETLKTKTTWQEMSPKRERKITRQNSSGSIKSSSSGSASGTSGSSDYSGSPPSSPTKSWKSIRENNRNNALSWKDLSSNKSGDTSDEHLPSKGTSTNENQIGKCVCSPEHRGMEGQRTKLVQNQTTQNQDTDNASITAAINNTVTDNGKTEHGHVTTCVHTTDNGHGGGDRNPACNCKANVGKKANPNVNNKNQGSPEHTCKPSSRLESAPSEEQNNEYFYDEDFTVQFDTNLRESSPGLNCTCIDPTIVSDFPNIATGSYLSFNNMKGSGLFDQQVNTELFCPDESELSSCRNSVMDMSSSEREMMCSSDMLEFSDNPLFTPSPTKELEKQNVSTDSLDKNFRPSERCCQEGSLESSDGNLCVNCCPKKEDYFLSFDGSQGRSRTDSENDASLLSIGLGQGHWGQSSSGEEMVSEECTDSFHFCYMNGNGNVQHGHRRIKFQSLKAVQESNGDADIDESEGKLSTSLPKITRSPISEFNQKLNGGHNGKKGCCQGKRASLHKSNGSSPIKSSMRHTIPNRKVTSWKQVKSLKSLGKLDTNMDPDRSSSMPELYVQTWQSFTSQECLDIAKIAESFHGKRHSAYLLDLYQRVRNQSNPVSPETMANIEQILFHPLISQNRCHGEANLSAPIGPCGVCGRDGSHSSHTLTNSNIHHLVNTSRTGQQLDQYTRKRIIEWLEKDRLDGHCKAKGCQTEKQMKNTETIISPTTVTLWCGTKNFSARFPPHTRDCGIQTTTNILKERHITHMEQQTSPTLEMEYKRLYMTEVAQQTSPNSDRHDILSMLPETFTDLDDIIPRRNHSSHKHVPRSKSADSNVPRDTAEVPERGCISYYTFKTLPDLNFTVSCSDIQLEEEISLFDPIPVAMPIPILTPTFAKSFSGVPAKKETLSSGTTSKRSRSVPAKLVNQHLLKNAGESGSSSSGVSTCSTSSGIDPGYGTDERPFSVGSPSNDIERLLFYPPHIESAKREKVESESQKGEGQVETQTRNKPSHPKLKRVAENRVNKYANEIHPFSLDAINKPKALDAETENKADGKMLLENHPAVEHLYSLQEENTPVSSPDVSRCHHNCCQGEDCFFVNHPNQFSSESNSSNGSGQTKPNRKPLKSCLRKQHFLRSRSLSDPHNLGQTAESQKQRRKLNCHSYACEEVYLLTDESGQYYLCQSDNSSQSNESSGPIMFCLDDVVPGEGMQTVKLRRKNPAEAGTKTGSEANDALSGKRKSVSFASEVSFHDISPHPSPKHRVEEAEVKGEEAKAGPPVLARANSTESCESSSDSDGPPESFRLSPSTDQNLYSDRFDELERKRGMLIEVCQVSEVILNHFSSAKNPFDKLRLGSSADTPEFGDLILNRLCPALNQVVGDGLKPFLNGFQMFGRVNITVWKVAEISAEQGPYTRAIHDLVQQLKSNPALTSCSAKFEAFLFGLLNLRLLDYWMGYLRYSDSLTDKFYNSDGVIVLSRTCHERAYDEMLISLQPLSVLPFQLGLEYVLENSKYLSHSPTLSPNRNKSPLISPSLEKEIVVPPPKPARSMNLNGTGLISTKAWEWIKGSVCDDGSEQVETKVEEKKKEVSSNVSDTPGDKPSKNVEDMQIEKMQKPRESKVSVNKEKKPLSGGNQVDLKGMSDSFSGIAQKLLGMNTSRERNSESSVTKTPSVPNTEKKMPKEQGTVKENVETVSSKAKSGILKFFDKLLLPKDTGSAPKSQIPKRHSWNVPNEGGQRSPGSQESKNLSPVSGNKELKNSLEYQKQKFANARKIPKSKAENVVARSIQSEAKMESWRTDTRKTEEKCAGKNVSQKVEDKSSSKQARNPPSDLSLKIRNVPETPEKVPVKNADSPSRKFGSPQRRVADKGKVSKIPTLQKKSESKKPQRNSLVLDSSGYSSSSVLNSPTRVKHSHSAGQIPVPVQSPKKTKTNSSKNSEVSTNKSGSLKTVPKAPVDKFEGIISSTEFPSKDPTESVESNSSSECASLEIGPTLVAPCQEKKRHRSSVEKKTAEKSQNKTTPLVPGSQTVELDINSNSALPVPPDQAVGGGVQCVSGGTTQPAPSKDFMKPDFRYIETVTDFESSEISQLSYRKGDHFEVLAEIDSSWFYCVNGPQEGLVHVDAVKPLSDKDEFHLLHNKFS